MIVFAVTFLAFILLCKIPIIREITIIVMIIALLTFATSVGNEYNKIQNKKTQTRN